MLKDHITASFDERCGVADRGRWSQQLYSMLIPRRAGAAGLTRPAQGWRCWPDSTRAGLAAGLTRPQPTGLDCRYCHCLAHFHSNWMCISICVFWWHASPALTSQIIMLYLYSIYRFWKYVVLIFCCVFLFVCILRALFTIFLDKVVSCWNECCM